MQGELGVWDGRERRVQAQVPGPQDEAELPVHHVQDRRADAAGGGGQAGSAGRDLRRLHGLLARQRVPLRRLRLRLRHRRELPEEQDLLRLLVINQPDPVVSICKYIYRCWLKLDPHCIALPGHGQVPGHVEGEEQDAVRELQGPVQARAGRHPGGAPGHRPERDEHGHCQGASPLNQRLLLYRFPVHAAVSSVPEFSFSV